MPWEYSIKVLILDCHTFKWVTSFPLIKLARKIIWALIGFFTCHSSFFLSLNKSVTIRLRKVGSSSFVDIESARNIWTKTRVSNAISYQLDKPTNAALLINSLRVELSIALQRISLKDVGPFNWILCTSESNVSLSNDWQILP